MKTTTNDLDYLSGCARFYDRLVDLAGRIDKRGDAEAALEAVQSIAHFAWHCHPGRYADGSIENLALRIGEQLDSLADSDNAGCGAAVASPRSRSARRRVLHVATTALPIGGHTRWIRDWIANDPGSDHSVLLTRQGATSVPGWLGQVVEQRGGTLFRLPDTASLVSQAHVVRTIAQAAADLVVLYHHPDDVVPVVAFAKGGGPPVALYNHADHVFWLGSSIADVVVDFRESGRRLSASRRFPARSELLPCPLPPVVGAVSREQARERLGMRADQLVLLSIGSAYKYVPTSDQNFFASAINLLERHPAAHLYLVGVPWDESQPHLRSARHERLHFVGRVEDPASYQAAADVYLEGFPFTSLTAMLEAVRFGVPAVAAFGESRGVLQSDDLAIDGLWRCEATEDEYLSQA
jgi:glycosyltransferase involved in cell wall biosynthesis